MKEDFGKQCRNVIDIMRKRKTILIASIFLLILTSFHLVWNYYHLKSDSPLAKEGVLDLREFKLLDESSIPLNGEWTFFPRQFVEPGISNDQLSRIDKTFIAVPGDWRDSISKDASSSLGYGTYRIHILLGDHEKQMYRMYFSNIQTAAKVYINGKVVAERGQPSDHEANSIPKNSPFSVLVENGETEIDLVIQVSNFEDTHLGGIVASIQLGTDAMILKEQAISYASQFIVAILLLLHGIYLLISYFLFIRKKEILYLVVTFFFMSVATVTDDDKILLYLFPSISYEWSVKICISSYLLLILFFVVYFKSYLSEFKRLWIFQGYILYSIFCILQVIFSPIQQAFRLSDYVMIIILLFPVIIIPFAIFKVVLSDQRGSIYLFLAIISIASSSFWGLVKNIAAINIPYYPFDLIISLICFATYWFKQFFYVTKDSTDFAEKLQRMDKQKDDFLANTSHELRNPLHGIINMAQALIDNGKSHLDEDSKRNLQLLISVGQRMSLMLNDLLDISRLKEGRIRIETSSVSVASIALGVFDMLQFMKEGKQLEFVLDIPENFPNVKADENRLIQILFNLIHNAVKYSNKGKIIVSVEKLKGMAVIHVTDTGIGIDQQTLKNIFKPYVQGDSSITAIGGGIGLGLNICKQLVELHGGTISVKSAVNEGSTFSFTLPLANEFEQEANIQKQVFMEVAVGKGDTESELSIHPEHSRILVVDDDSVNVAIYKQILVSGHYDVFTCTTGKEALELLNKASFDLVISDVMMPYMSGYELTKKIRERFSISELPILLLTARSQPEDVQVGFHSGANDYVTKPVEKSVFIARVRALTEIKKSINERVRMEAAWLQAQIQPHFLFNTLNTIAALSELNQTKMLNLLHEFGNYLRASFDTRNLEKVVPLKDELELVRSYLFIEQQRFGERLTVEWEIDERLAILVPPLSIQTLVENAVQHGVLKRPQGGIIQIQIKEQGDYVKISIIDNGVGMTEDKIHQLLSSKPNQTLGIGVPNTDKRLKQLYGMGLIISSELNEGTIVTFMIPKEIIV